MFNLLAGVLVAIFTVLMCALCVAVTVTSISGKWRQMYAALLKKREF